MDGRDVGRYVVFDEIAVGGMAAVHIGRLLGTAGFSRTVAMKRLHRQFAGDPEFVAMFLDEARIAGRIRHPNVVSTLDVVNLDNELYLVMDYVQGESIAHLMRSLGQSNAKMPPGIAVSIACEMLAGLHAAHEATDDRGEPLGIVHRDVSPQNVLVGTDGIARVVDFGVAKAVGRIQTTREGQIKGKTAYMAPEQIRGRPVDRRTDVYSASVVLWEMLTGERLFKSDSAAGAMTQVLEKVIPPPGSIVPGIAAGLDAAVLRGLSRDAADRFATARELGRVLEEVCARESAMRIGDWVRQVAGQVLDERAQRITRIERSSLDGPTPPPGAAPPTLAPGRSDVETVASLVGTASESMPHSLRRRVRVLGWTAGVVALAGVLSTVGMARRSRPGHDPSAVPAAIPSLVADTPPPSAPQPPAASDVPPAASVVPSPPPASSSVHNVPTTPTAPTAPTPRPRARCTPPYTVDKDGIHIPKPWCL
jgi:serine/threonine protein kinase